MKLALKLRRRNADVPRPTLRERATALKASAAKVMRRPLPASAETPEPQPAPDFLSPPPGFIATLCGGIPHFVQAEPGVQWEAQRLLSTVRREYGRQMNFLPNDSSSEEVDAADVKIRLALRLDALRLVAFGPSPEERANPSRDALVSYATWLHGERRAVCRELYPHLGDKADQFVIGDHGMTAFDYHRGDHGPASSRALDVLALAGCDWKDGKPPIADDLDGRYIPSPDLAALERAFRAAQGTVAENDIATRIMQAVPHTLADLAVKARTLRACEPDWFTRPRGGTHGLASWAEIAAGQIADGVAALASMGAIDGQASVGGPSQALTALLDAHQLAYATCLHGLGEEGADVGALKVAEEEAFRALLHTPLITDADQAAYAQAVIERQTGFLVAGRSIDRDHPLAVAYRNLRFGEHVREAPDQFEAPEPEPAAERLGRSYTVTDEALSGVSIAGLISLYETFASAAHVYSSERNSPRVKTGTPTDDILNAEWERCNFTKEAVIRELEARAPADAWDREYRTSVLARQYALGCDWELLAEVTAEAMRANEAERAARADRLNTVEA